MRETVDLDGLAIKIYGKYLKFLQQKVHEIIDRPPALNQGGKKDEEERKKKENIENKEISDGLNGTMANDTMNFSELPIENSKL